MMGANWKLEDKLKDGGEKLNDLTILLVFFRHARLSILADGGSFMTVDHRRSGHKRVDTLVGYDTQLHTRLTYGGERQASWR